MGVFCNRVARNDLEYESRPEAVIEKAETAETDLATCNRGVKKSKLTCPRSTNLR